MHAARHHGAAQGHCAPCLQLHHFRRIQVAQLVVVHDAHQEGKRLLLGQVQQQHGHDEREALHIARLLVVRAVRAREVEQRALARQDAVVA